MRNKNRRFKKTTIFGLVAIGCSMVLWSPFQMETIEAAKSVTTHLGTFEGRTTFTTSSSNGINPGLFLEVMDEDGNLTQYESEEGVITIPDTKEGAYITQAKLLGKTKYIDEETGEVLDTWEEGRNLRLESSENPVLQTIGKNLFNLLDDDKLCVYAGGNIVTEDHSRIYQITESTINVVNQGTFANHLGYKLPIKNIDSVVISGEGFGATFFYRYFGENFIPLTGQGQRTKGYSTDGSGRKYVVLNRSEFPPEAEYIFLGLGDHSLSNYTMKDIQIETSSSVTPYMPYQSNTLTINKEVALHKIGDRRDELDLITGDYTQGIETMVLNGSENWQREKPSDSAETIAFSLRNTLGIKPSYDRDSVISPSFKSASSEPDFAKDEELIFCSIVTDMLIMKIFKNRQIETVQQFKEWLATNNVFVEYKLNDPVTQTVALSSDYFFKPINKESIEVVGTFDPLVASITVPTDSLLFTLDPNQEDGQQFIAPDFTLTNETFAPLQVELKTFEQTSDVLNDVLPEAHENWNELNKTESQDIALALVPTPSDGWLSLDEGPRYVVNTSNDFIGTVKGKSSVGFSFNALHGQSFSEVLNPQYRLVFMFGFNQ